MQTIDPMANNSSYYPPAGGPHSHDDDKRDWLCCEFDAAENRCHATIA